MPEQEKPEIYQQRSDSLKAAVPQYAETPSASEKSVPILEVHAPNEALHTWRGFLLHIATIVIGLFVAVGL
jgi:hypothetical protein